MNEQLIESLTEKALDFQRNKSPKYRNAVREAIVKSESHSREYLEGYLDSCGSLKNKGLIERLLFTIKCGFRLTQPAEIVGYKEMYYYKLQKEIDERDKK
ncbi:MAG: hypothetical protein AABX11_04735 [Nanoarchaeota archaeon]